MNEVTLDELLEQQEELEKNIKESAILQKKWSKIAKEIYNVAQRGNIKIITDYDADGICSAYIMRQVLFTANPQAKVDVICNDRRNPYGVPRDLQKEEGCDYIVLDMGSNELEYILDTFGQNTIIIDHHIIEDEEARIAFARDNTLLNPHSLQGTKEVADYCATGLAYRLLRVQEIYYKIETEKVVKNTCLIMAAIGTIADCVNVMDTNSFNRLIIRDGMDAINDADFNNIDHTIGYFIAACLEDKGRFQSKCDISSKNIAFDIAPVLNAGGRMSEVKNMNGAQYVFDTLIRKHDVDTQYRINECIEMNKLRKSMLRDILSSDSYKSAVEFEKDRESNICLYRLPDDTPSSIAGLIAGQFSSKTGKASIVVSYHTDKGYFVGSCRNSDEIETGIKDFIDSIAADIPEFEYGGHANAMGVSKLSSASYDILARKLEEMGSEMKLKEDVPRLVLKPEELADPNDPKKPNPETIEKLKKLEPFGTGWKLPRAEFRGKMSRQKYLKTTREIKMNCDNAEVKLKEWDFNDEDYPLLADNTFMALGSVELSRRFDTETQTCVETIAFNNEMDRLFKEKVKQTVEQVGLAAPKKKDDVGRP